MTHLPFDKVYSIGNRGGFACFSAKEGSELFSFPLTAEGFTALVTAHKAYFEANPKLSVYVPMTRFYGFPEDAVKAWEKENSVYTAVRKIESNQPLIEDAQWISILWNKARYFEFSIYNKELRNFVSQSAGVKVEYGTMLVGGRTQLERVVKALNKKGYYVNINQDWI